MTRRGAGQNSLITATRCQCRRCRHPGASEGELTCRFAALLYGRDAARRLFGSLADELR